jgi:hypothetical protein
VQKRVMDVVILKHYRPMLDIVPIVAEEQHPLGPGFYAIGIKIQLKR